jgi:hypothetical protein
LRPLDVAKKTFLPSQRATGIEHDQKKWTRGAKPA